MRNFKQFTTLLLFIFFNAQFSIAQLDPINIQVVPPSPNASSLGKFGDVPVGLYTGTPSIGVPIFDINGRELSVPIALSYHAGGIKVEEVASNVGLGWSLQAGGMISRTMRGEPDEHPTKGSLNHGIAPRDVLLSEGEQRTL